MIKWEATEEEYDLITAIAQRGAFRAAEKGLEYDQMTAIMDIEACHCNGTPLRLQDLLYADDDEFANILKAIHELRPYYPEVSMPDKGVIEKVVDELANILKAIHELLYLYEQNNWLRDGIDISGIVPMSIDDWWYELLCKIDDLRFFTEVKQ